MKAFNVLLKAIALRACQVIPGSGGLRKLRWAGSGRGKRGGLSGQGKLVLLLGGGDKRTQQRDIATAITWWHQWKRFKKK